MRKPRIPTSGKVPALTQLKQLDAEIRADLWTRTQGITNKQGRELIQKEFGIRLSSDSQLSKWRSWQLRQSLWDRYQDMVAQDEQAMQDCFPEVPREKIRELAIKRCYAAADLIGDPEVTLKVVQTDLKDSQDSRDWEKLELLKKKAAQAEEAQTVATSDLTPEEKAAKLQEIFGIIATEE